MPAKGVNTNTKAKKIQMDETIRNTKEGLWHVGGGEEE